MHVFSGPHGQPLRGRSVETAKINTIIHSVRDFGSILVSIEGALGSGKSRILREAGHIAEQIGIVVSNGLPAEEERLDRPLAILLDDLHCAGEQEMAVLTALRGRLVDTPTVWFVSRRSGLADGPVDSVLCGLTGSCEQLTLSPLPETAVHEMATDLLGCPPDEDFQQVLGATKGNPELIKAFVVGLREEGRIDFGVTAGLRECQIPDQVRVLVRRLLRTCSEPCRRMLWGVAAFGGHVAFDELTRMLDSSPSELLSSLDEATTVGLVSDFSGDIAFANELFYYVTQDTMPSPAFNALRQHAAAQTSNRVDGPRLTSVQDGAVHSRVTDVRAQQHFSVGRSGPSKWSWRTSSPRGSTDVDVGHVGAVAYATDVVTSHPAAYRPSGTGWDGLSDVQHTIVRLVSRGLTNRQIAERVYLSPHTVNYHLRKIYHAFAISSRIDLVRVAYTHCLQTEDHIDG